MTSFPCEVDHGHDEVKAAYHPTSTLNFIQRNDNLTHIFLHIKNTVYAVYKYTIFYLFFSFPSLHLSLLLLLSFSFLCQRRFLSSTMVEYTSPISITVVVEKKTDDNTSALGVGGWWQRGDPMKVMTTKRSGVNIT